MTVAPWHRSTSSAWRFPWAIVAVVAAAVLAVQPVGAAVSWSASVKSSPSLASNTGLGLARTVSTVSGKTYLHTQYTWAGTEYPGVYYRRGNATGTTWGTHLRVNPEGTYADVAAIAAAGSTVYVAYRTVGSITDFDPAAPRSLGVRINTNHGSATAWQAPRVLDGVTRGGRPSVAASGSRAWIAYTDADTGEIVVATNGGSNAVDAVWTSQVIGGTAYALGEPGSGDYEGSPVIAASGSTVAIAYLEDQNGGLTVRVSTNAGATWGVWKTLTAAEIWDPSIAVKSGRIAVAWAQANGIQTRLYRSGTWLSARTVAGFSSGSTYKAGYGTAVALAGTGRVAVAWAACSRVSCTASSTAGVSVRWRESSDNLASWKTTQTLASYTFGSTRRINDFPSIVMTSTPKRYVTYNSFAADLSGGKVLFELGS